jgi:hypothetical protein
MMRRRRSRPLRAFLGHRRLIGSLDLDATVDTLTWK